jgi:RNA polymerase sigma-70 factor, ECF subfamily
MPSAVPAAKTDTEWKRGLALRKVRSMKPAEADATGEPKRFLALVPGQPQVRRAVTAGPEPVRELWRHHGTALLRFACKLTLGDWQRAEDIVQETLVRAWRHPEVVGTGQTPIRPWLYTVARRVAIDMWRARSPTEELADGEQPDIPEPWDRIGRTITALDVRAALATLSAPHRRVIIEMYYNDRSVAETARLLGIPPGTVKSRAHYATRQLRRILAPSREHTVEARQERRPA